MVLKIAKRDLADQGIHKVIVKPLENLFNHANSISELVDAVFHIANIPVAGGIVPKALMSGRPSIGSSHSYWQSVLQPHNMCTKGDCHKKLEDAMNRQKSGCCEDITPLLKVNPESKEYLDKLYKEIRGKLNGYL